LKAQASFQPTRVLGEIPSLASVVLIITLAGRFLLFVEGFSVDNILGSFGRNHLMRREGKPNNPPILDWLIELID